MFDTSMKTLAVRVLADFGVDGVEPAALGSRKARQALHLLGLADGHCVPVDVLIDALWGDTPPARPDDQVAVLMSRLRSVLGKDRIEHRDNGYLLRCDWLDAAELAALIDEVERRRDGGNVVGAAAAARAALGLVRGPGPAAPIGEWGEIRRSELDRLIGRARQAAAGALLEAGDWVSAADAAATAIDHDPYDEAALRVLLRAYVMGGQVAAALAVYASARERLAEDLGTDPSPETAAVYTAILRGELALPRPAPVGDGLALVGRDAELASLDAIVQRAGPGPAEIVVIEGEAGIGKTALLRAWSAHRVASGDDTVLLASCGELDRSMPLDALISALSRQLRRLGTDEAADVLGADGPILVPLLGGPDSPRHPALVSESMLGPGVLYGAIVRVLSRLSGRRRLIVLIDDAHLAGRALSDWLRFVRREGPGFLIVAAIRPGEGAALPATATIRLDLLDRAAVEQLVGPARAGALYALSKGHPLFLTELAQRHGDGELPASLVESVSARCEELGTAGSLLRTAAVIGPELDVDLLAAVLGRPVVTLLDEAEEAVSRQFLTEEGGIFRFRHDLVMQALAASASASRSALLHRQAGRVLASRPGADPALIAYQARLGGDLELASRSLADAASLAAERFDHEAAEELLDDAVSLHASAPVWLARARVRTRRGRYGEALSDVERAESAGAAALEVGAWACYFDRQFARAAAYAQDGAVAAADPATRARCLAVGGRTRHAAGDLAQAEMLLGEALALSEGPERVTAAAWLGVLRSHQSRTAEALSLLRPAARGQVGVEHTSATLHALLFTGHSHALEGNAELALQTFSRYTAEVERRHVPRFAGRGVNFAGWVLRNLGARSEGLDHHLQALDIARDHGTAEVAIAALEDLAEQCLDDGDLDAAGSRLAEARVLLHGDLVFGWRLDLKLRLLAGRLALALGQAESACTAAADLESVAGQLGVPRYAGVARLLRHRAGKAAGEAGNMDEVAADLDVLDSSAGIEAWWWTGDLAQDFASVQLLDRAADRVARLLSQAGSHADDLQSAASRRMDRWQASIG
jgi:DNA-binding SARP family transcriptional activator